jgi:hypothetical protein
MGERLARQCRLHQGISLLLAHVLQMLIVRPLVVKILKMYAERFFL